MAMKMVDFDADVSAKTFETAEHVAYKLYVVACFTISRKFLITSTNAVKAANFFWSFG